MGVGERGDQFGDGRAWFATGEVFRRADPYLPGGVPQRRGTGRDIGFGGTISANAASAAARTSGSRSVTGPRTMPAPPIPMVASPRANIADSPGPTTTVTRLRGVQAALALHGVDLELPPNLAYSVGPGLTSTLVDQDVGCDVACRLQRAAI